MFEFKTIVTQPITASLQRQSDLTLKRLRDEKKTNNKISKNKNFTAKTISKFGSTL